MAGREPLASSQNYEISKNKVGGFKNNRSIYKPFVIMFVLHLVVISNWIVYGYHPIQALSASIIDMAIIAIFVSFGSIFITTRPSTIPKGIRDPHTINAMMADQKYRLSFTSHLFYPLLYYIYVLFAYIFLLFVEGIYTYIL